MAHPSLRLLLKNFQTSRCYAAPAVLGTVAIALLTLSGCSGVRQSLASVLGKSETSTEALPKANFAKSTPAQIALIEHLNSVGAKLYGTYWCPYCTRQKELFGEAVSKLQLVECDPNGKDAQPSTCARANVSSYPTWEIKGQQYPGMHSLDELAALSGYKGSLNFTQ